MSDIEITAGSTEHDWSRMPLRMRLGIGWAVLRGAPFHVPGSMRILALNATRSSDARLQRENARLRSRLARVLDLAQRTVNMLGNRSGGVWSRRSSVSGGGRDR